MNDESVSATITGATARDRLGVFVKALQEANPTVTTDEAERAYLAVTSRAASSPAPAALPDDDLTRDEADALAAIPNEHARLKQFRKVRGNAICNVCRRRIGNHSDRQLTKCFRSMREAVAHQSADNDRARQASAVPARELHPTFGGSAGE